ncbi:hypothetical protein KP509_31G057300 [Ceratopteris richardii]|uniref:DUF659 domain-containing protein n=1 Tax=Ceratopteris richardii TaxID=49495 RepID=A0A8T2QZT7_CERRI|nr:hypothetical protein KP509_31G057300 [Ceratopteris richardii]
MGKGKEWSYVIVHQEGKTISTIQCKCCGHHYVGNATRIKEHLLGTGNNVARCSNPDSDIWVHFASYANKCKSHGITSKRFKSMSSSQHFRSSPSVEQERVDVSMTVEDHQDISTQVSQTVFENNQDTLLDYVPMYGCTIPLDGWTSCQKKPLINVMVICPKGNMFLEVVDTSLKEKSSAFLVKVYEHAISRMGGPKNVTPIVTDNASNFRSVGITIQNKYEGITWVPCAAHTLNLLLKDIGRLSFIKQSLLDANNVAWLEKYPSYRVASSKCTWLIQSQNFWHSLEKTVGITKPFVELLRMADTDKFLTGRVYWIVSETIQKVKDFNQFSLREKTQIVSLAEKRWMQMHTHLHGTTFILDPTFQLNGQASNKEVMANFKTTCQLLLLGSFGDLWHLEAIQTHPPPIGWKEYGGEAAELQHIAMRVLSVAASSGSFERNWSAYYFLHSKRRNR